MSQISHQSSCSSNYKSIKTNSPMTLDKAVATVKENFDLLDTAAGIGGKDGLIGVVDLEAITKTPAAPSHLKEAAQFLLNNPAYRNQLDVAAGIGKVDGLIGKVDVDAFQKDHSPRRKQYQQMSCHNPVPQGAVATIPFPFCWGK